MDKKEIRYGIVGIGKQGTLYTKIFTKLSGLVKGAKLTAVCDILPERRKYAEENLKGVKVFDNYQDMFASGLIDVVMVETPHYFHPQIAIDAMKAGLNVLCDKPAGVYTKQVREMNEEAKKHPELLFGMMFNQRTNPLYIKAKEIIDSGRLGKLTRIVWIITNWYRRVRIMHKAAGAARGGVKAAAYFSINVLTSSIYSPGLRGFPSA